MTTRGFLPTIPLAAVLVLAACGDGFQPQHEMLPDGSTLSAVVRSSVEVSSSPDHPGGLLPAGPFSNRIQAVLRDGRLEVTQTGRSEDGLAHTTTYAMPDSLMAMVLPALTYLQAQYTPPHPSLTQPLDYGAETGEVMSLTDRLGSLGQPLSTTLSVNWQEQYRETFNWTPTSTGVQLRTARYDISDLNTGALVRITALVDSVRVTVLSQAPFAQEFALAGIGVDLAPVLASMGPEDFAAFLGLVASSSPCSSAKVDLWIARAFLAAATTAFATAPNPGTFAGFAVAWAHAGTMRKRARLACKA